MFSTNHSKRWSVASILLAFMWGLVCGLTVWACSLRMITFWMFVPMILFAILFIWYANGEEKEWMEQRR